MGAGGAALARAAAGRSGAVGVRDALVGAGRPSGELGQHPQESAGADGRAETWFDGVTQSGHRSLLDSLIVVQALESVFDFVQQTFVHRTQAQQLSGS